MSAVLEPPAARAEAAAARPVSPTRRALERFCSNRWGVVSLIVFVLALALAGIAELVSNDRPIVARIDGRWLWPLFANPPETAIGGDFATPTDWRDPYVRRILARPGNLAWFTVNAYGPESADYFDPELPPAPPSARHWLGSDSKGRDMVARLLYGFRVSIGFALALTLVGTVLGVAAGALQGYFGGRTDLLLQRATEIWGSVPELYLLIIFASIFEPSLLLLLVLLSLWGWMGLADYVRAEFLRNRNLVYV
jgi:microcin C transport system permease protein